MTKPTHILATGTALPGAAVDNADLCAVINAKPEWIDLFVGTRTRHFAIDLATGKQTHNLADLALEAAQKAMTRADVTAAEIGFLVLSTATPDHLMPTTANLVADALGLNRIPTFQLQSGCSGAIAAFDVGIRLLDTDRPFGLVIGADVCVKHLRLDRGASAAMTPSELVNFVLFGDGAGAAVLSLNEAGSRMTIESLINRFSGLGRPPGQQIEWFGLADRDLGLSGLNEDYKAIEQQVPSMSSDVLDGLVGHAQLSRDDLDYLLPPQLSGRMTKRIVDQLSLPFATEVSVVADTGNNGNALPFLQIDILASRIASGERAAVVAIESSKWIESGMILGGPS